MGWAIRARAGRTTVRPSSLSTGRPPRCLTLATPAGPRVPPSRPCVLCLLARSGVRRRRRHRVPGMYGGHRMRDGRRHPHSALRRDRQRGLRPTGRGRANAATTHAHGAPPPAARSAPSPCFPVLPSPSPCGRYAHLEPRVSAARHQRPAHAPGLLPRHRDHPHLPYAHHHSPPQLDFPGTCLTDCLCFQSNAAT